jgi:hypothetical protein
MLRLGRACFSFFTPAPLTRVSLRTRTESLVSAFRCGSPASVTCVSNKWSSVRRVSPPASVTRVLSRMTVTSFVNPVRCVSPASVTNGPYFSPTSRPSVRGYFSSGPALGLKDSASHVSVPDVDGRSLAFARLRPEIFDSAHAGLDNGRDEQADEDRQGASQFREVIRRREKVEEQHGDLGAEESREVADRVPRHDAELGADPRPRPSAERTNNRDRAENPFVMVSDLTPVSTHPNSPRRCPYGQRCCILER